MGITGRSRFLLYLIATTIIIGLVITTNLIDQLIMMVFLGLIPGTDLAVPGWLAIPLAIVAALLAIDWLGRQTMYIGHHQTFGQKQARQLARRRVMARLGRQPRPLPTNQNGASTRRRFDIESV